MVMWPTTTQPNQTLSYPSRRWPTGGTVLPTTGMASRAPETPAQKRETGRRFVAMTAPAAGTGTQTCATREPNVRNQ
jgi:hypothetical protein